MERLEAEADELIERGGKLQKFLATSEFDSLPETDRGLLLAQFGTVTSLLAILALRLKRAKGEIKDA